MVRDRAMDSMSNIYKVTCAAQGRGLPVKFGVNQLKTLTRVIDVPFKDENVELPHEVAQQFYLLL